MKKIISIVAVVAMLCLFGVSALATSPIQSVSDGLNSDSHDVVAKSSGSVIIPDVYSVDVSWGVMQFTYSVSGSKTWDPTNHTYNDNSSAGWSANGNTITVTNHSNKAVTANFGFAKDSSITESITGEFSITSKLLVAGVVNEYDTADAVTSTLTIGGVLDSEKTDFTKIGSVTVTIQ